MHRAVTLEQNKSIFCFQTYKRRSGTYVDLLKHDKNIKVIARSMF